jgi:3-phytase
MRRGFGFISVAVGIFLSGCAATTTVPTVASAPTVEVPAAGETVAVATRLADAADDPAIWARADGKSFTFAGKDVPGIILGTDKKAGLYAFSLDGDSLQFLPEGLLNNVDLRTTGEGFVAGASDRGRMGVALYRFEGSGELAPAGFIKSDVVEPYGFCMGNLGGQLIAVLVAKDGGVRIYGLVEQGGNYSGTELRRFAIPTQSEGCVVDDATGTLYVGEEMAGVWRIPLDPAQGERTLIAKVGDGRLIADVEGMTILRDGGTSYLIVSSQGDSAFAIWQLAAAGPAYIGRFRVGAAGGVDAVSGTDGLDAWSGSIGRFPNGLVVTQDDQNEGGAQNFKLVDWAAIRTAIGR